MTAALIHNRCYNRRVEQTPHCILTGKKPNLLKIKVFGSVCYAYKQDKRQLDLECKKGIFDTQIVLKHGFVKFMNSVVGCQTQTDLDMCDDDLHGKRLVPPMPKAR